MKMETEKLQFNVLTNEDLNELKSSIENKLFTLDENINVYPGHGWKSTVGHEKENNRFL